jgi:thiol-disulfide isomerase/thioredoxin
MSYAAAMTRNSGAFAFVIAMWLCATAFVATLRIASAQEPPKNFIFVDKPAPVADITFDDAEGQARKLADFKGKVLLVNIWATWCGPCRTEMPALDRLQARLGGADFEVIPVSIDRAGMESIRKFYSGIGVRNLAMYIDPSGQVLRRTRAPGLPTTLLIDRGGQEIGRAIGPAEWDAPEIAEFLRPFIENKNLSDRADRENSRTSDCPDAPSLITRSLRWLKIC